MSEGWDQSEFDRTLDEYIKQSPRELSEILNKKMAIIINEARKLTPVADRSAIESEFGLEVETRVSKKTGKTRRRITAVNAPPGVALVIWKLRRAGKPLPSNAELQEMARRLPSNRLRAVGSLRSGWSRAIRAYSQATGQGSSLAGPRVRHAGTAKVAQPGWDPVAEASFNLATQSAHDSDLHIDPRVEDALRQAFEHETASMKEYIERKLQERMNSISAK